MDEPATVFYLEPLEDLAIEMVEDEANHKRRRIHPNNVAKCFLRIGFDLPAKIPSRLVTFTSNSDVILSNTRSSNTDQCYLDFHPTTRELLLHDISKKNDTQLSTADGDDTKQIWQSPRQWVVQLKHEWIFHMGQAKFRLIPRRTPTEQEQEAFTADRLAFVRQIPDEFRTLQGTLEGLEALGMQSMQLDASTVTARD